VKRQPDGSFTRFAEGLTQRAVLFCAQDPVISGFIPQSDLQIFSGSRTPLQV